MRIAVISDIHGNLEALEAVLADIEKARAEKIVCLGDMIGYGPNPIEVADAVHAFAAAAVMGNHEVLVTRGVPPRTSPLAEKAAVWTRRKLAPHGGKTTSRKSQRWEWLKTLPKYVKLDDMIFAHGTPDDCFTYVMGLDEAVQVFEREMHGTSLCLIGHTHVPGIFAYDGKQVGYAVPEPGKRARPPKGLLLIVNVGSVGQPRDQDPRASYALIGDDRSFEIRRVEYPVEKTAEKIYAIKDLPNALGERLLIGE